MRYILILRRRLRRLVTGRTLIRGTIRLAVFIGCIARIRVLCILVPVLFISIIAGQLFIFCEHEIYALDQIHPPVFFAFFPHPLNIIGQLCLCVVSLHHVLNRR